MPQARLSYLLFPAILVASFFALAPLHAQSNAEAVEAALASVTPHDRVVQPVEDNQRVSLDGNTLPQALPAHETGTVDGGKRFDRMVLVLKPDPTQKAALDALTAAQQDPASPLYHQWLTPETYAAHFGASSADIEQVQDWLQRNGFQVDEIAASHQTLVFSGTATQVEAAFQTTMRTYSIHGQKHIANSSDPMVPAALAPVVAGVASLHDVFSAPQHTTPVKAYSITPEYTSGGAHYLSPADYATIYDISSLYNQAYNGTGETIAIVGRSDISLPDERSFRSTFGLPAKDPVSIQNGSTDPGASVTDDVDEAMLDTEWSGAVAVSGLPSGVTAKFSSSKVAAPGSGSSTLTLTASKTATIGAAKLQTTVTGTGFSGVAAMPFTVVSAGSAVSESPGSTGSTTVVAAPATAGIPLDLYTTITALGQNVPVYTAITRATDVGLPGTLGLAKFSSFDFSGTVPVAITITGADYPITSAIVKTIIGGVAQSYIPTFTSSTISFTVTQAAQYYVCVNNDWANSIHVFANPIVGAPSPTGPGVQVVNPGSYSSIALTGSNSILYFGPGIYTLTAHTPITLTANQQLYLADGAFLFFGHNMTASNSRINITGNNARVFGRGVIDGSQIPGNGYITQFSISGGICTIYAAKQYLAGDTGTLVYMGYAPLDNVSYTVLSSGLTPNTFQFAISLGNQALQATTGSTASTAFNMLKGAAAGWTVDGLIFRDAPNFNLWAHNTSAPTINNYKAFGWRLNSDGIDIDSANAATVTNSFLRTFDDLVAVKTTGTVPITNLTVSNIMLFRQRARGIIFSDAGLPISGATVNGIYVIQDETEAQINPLFAVNPTTAGVSISNITFENIAVDQAMSLISLKTPLAAPISTITFENLTSALPSQIPSIFLTGFSAADEITNTLFENVMITECRSPLLTSARTPTLACQMFCISEKLA